MNRFRKGLISLVLGSSILFPNYNTISDEVKDPFDPTKTIIVENGPNESELNNARNRLKENGINKNQVDNIEKRYLFAYSELLENYSTDVIEKTLELHSVYPEGMDNPVFLYRYANIIKNTDSKDLVKFKEFRKKHPDRDNLDMINEYFKLIKKNVPLEIISELTDEEILFWDINSNFFMPENFIKSYTLEPYKKSIEYGMKIIGKNDPIKIRNELINRIEKRGHVISNSLEFIESADQLKNLDDPVFIGLISGLDDFLSKSENIKTAAKIFDPIYKNIKTERLAIMKFSDEEIKFEILLNEKNFEESGVYLANESRCYLPPSLYFTEKEMNIHSHILTLGAKSQLYPYPSGPMKEPFLYGDTKALSLSNKYNPYHIDGVISELGNSRFNFDILLRKVKYQDDKPVNYGNCIVIDMGVFEY